MLTMQVEKNINSTIWSKYSTTARLQYKPKQGRRGVIRSCGAISHGSKGLGVINLGKYFMPIAIPTFFYIIYRTTFVERFFSFKCTQNHCSVYNLLWLSWLRFYSISLQIEPFNWRIHNHKPMHRLCIFLIQVHVCVSTCHWHFTSQENFTKHDKFCFKLFGSGPPWFEL